METENTAASWPAHLRLRFEQREAIGTRLVETTHSGPLRVQRPFYPEGADCAHAYVLHPPGGLVSGDALLIEVGVAKSASALITTPGAGRIYRARTAHLPARQSQHIRLTVDNEAALEWLPQATLVFDGADVLLDLQVDLAADSAFIGWETVCLGRPASALPFVHGNLEQRWRVVRDGVPLLNDRLYIRGDADSGDVDSGDVDSKDTLRSAHWGLQSLPVYGTLLAVPRARQSLPASLVDELRALMTDHSAEREIAITRVRNLLILRYLGTSTERAHTLFEAAWMLLRPHLLQRKAVRPRIWNT